MSYPDRDYYITFLFEQLETFNTSVASVSTPTVGRPKSYTDDWLIVLFALLTLKGIYCFKAQHRWLKLHLPQMPRFNLQTIPARATLSRRYKQLACRLEAFIEFLGDLGMTLIADASLEVVYQDKSLFKAKGPVWHQKDRNANRLPKGLRAVDTDASWSVSKYHGWVYGYGLHLTVCPEGLPLMSVADTACVSEKAILDQQMDKMLEQNVGYIVADAGYTDLKRTEKLANKGLLLITPVIGAKRPQTQCYVETINQSQRLHTYQQKRKVAIEPIFELLKQLLSTHNNHKQLPVKGKPNVRTFLMLGVVLLQVAMLVNSIWGRPLRNVTHFITIFR